MAETRGKVTVQLDNSAVAHMFGSWGSSRSTAYGTSKATCIQNTNKSKGSAFSAKSQVDEKNDLKELVGGKKLKIKLPVPKDTNRIAGESCLSPTRKRSKKEKVQTPLPKEKPSLSLEEAAGDKTTEDEEDQYYAYTHTPKRKKLERNTVTKEGRESRLYRQIIPLKKMIENDLGISVFQTRRTTGWVRILIEVAAVVLLVC